MGLFDIFKSKKMNSEGPVKTFDNNEERFNSMISDTKEMVNQPENKFCLIIEDIFKLVGKGTVVTGYIQYGSLFVGDEVFINNHHAKVLGIEKFRKSLTEAHEGDTVGVLLQIEYNLVRIGDVIEK